jgi:hypothetical protein
MEFRLMKEATDKQFAKMLKQNNGLFRTTIDKDLMLEAYIKAFPTGTNPVYRERTEHDCSCCKQFIRQAGNIVAIGTNGKLMSIWDIPSKDPMNVAYHVVAKAMSDLVKSKPIENVCLQEDYPIIGTDFNFEECDDNGTVKWEHFMIKLPAAYVCRKVDIGTKLGESKAKHDVFERGLKELTDHAVDTVLELIDQGSLYKGDENRFAVAKFKEAKRLYAKASNKDYFVWFFMNVPTPNVAMIRNTSIGQLLINLSEDMPLETAVGKFEAMVAPSNYKRPTALVTKSMVENARKRVEELGFNESLARRFANTEDITINNVLFANRDTQPMMAGYDPFADLATVTAIKSGALDKVEEVQIDDFINCVLPSAKSLEVMLENRQAGNLVSLIAPVNEAPTMFKWGNNFSWAYNGEMADSMKERVKSAGGDITGDLRFSIQWNDETVHNRSDYDAWCKEADGTQIDFRHVHSRRSGGKLDVDIQCPGVGKPAVENITYASRSKMPDGKYQFLVHNFASRGGDTGFRAEIEFDGVIHSFNYPQKLRSDQRVQVATVTLKDGAFTIHNHLQSATASRELWGVQTQDYHQVKMMMLSPNYWDERLVGNKHFFFMLEGCLNPDPARGFFNEFLTQELDKDRKVFEMLGASMRAQHTDNQLSGLGFSVTQRNHVFMKVDGNFKRTIKVTF